MKLVKSIRRISDYIDRLKRSGKSIGFVPTMGYLHQGHLSLVRAARKQNDIVVVSIFVNPIQFGPKEDLKIYPRDLKRDCSLLEKENVDFVFYPKADEIYPKEFKTYVYAEDLSRKLCGKFRPIHFRGVTTIVAKLFNIIKPDRAYFGQKDAQQAIIIRKMVKDLNMPIKIDIMLTIREKDGLAMSSRNVYLNENRRRDAAVLFQALILAKDSIRKGEHSSKKIISKMRELVVSKKDTKIDYISIVDIENLDEVRNIKKKVLIAMAVWLGKTRLIDNIIV